VEAESGFAAEAPEKMLGYSVLLRRRHGLPVRSVLLLLRPEANATNLDGVLSLYDPEEQALAAKQNRDPRPYLIFRYEVVRLWLEPLAPLLGGPLGLLPLAALTDEAARDLPAAVKRITGRLRQEAPGEEAAKLETATFVLLGLRYDDAVIRGLFEEV